MDDALGLIALVAATSVLACSTGHDALFSSGGGFGGAGGVAGASSGAAGEAGGGASSCGVDCSQIEAPPCQVAVCDEQAGKCKIIDAPDGTPCEDGLFCTSHDSCIQGECVAGPPNDCAVTPGTCQQVACDEGVEACYLAPAPDGAACTDPEDLCLQSPTCQSGFCVGLTKDCHLEPVPNECQVSLCNPQSGNCEPFPGNEGQPCSDPSELCTINKSCNAGACQGGQPKDCSQLSHDCLVGVCNAQSGQCVLANAPNGFPCDDLDGCTIGESCQNSVCSGGNQITQCVGGDLCCPPSCTINSDSDCNPPQIILDAVNRGWWRDDGFHESLNDNTLTGRIDQPNHLYNSYFTFDLSGISGTVVSAELELEVESYTSPDPSETISVWDVSTSAAILEADGTGQIAIHTDLMTGNQYGSFTVQPSDAGSVMTIPLAAQAVADINAVLGGSFSVGCHNDTISGQPSQWVRFSVYSEARIHQLVLSVL